MTKPRVGLIGARRHRQGLGPYVARELAAAGATVAGFLGTRPEALPEAAASLERAGVHARGYLELPRLLEAENVDALAILSPSPTHEGYLRAAAEAGLHVLCEKPLVWGEGRLAARAGEVVAAFRDRKLLLAENCQWPYTLEAFRALHPDVTADPPRQFSMRLSPISTGRTLLGDCLSHPLSVLQALVPGERPEVANIRYELLSDDASSLDLRFDFRVGAATVQVSLELVSQPEPPRVAALAIDGRRAERKVRMADYAMTLEDGGRTVSLPDPLTPCVRGFVQELESVLQGAPPADPGPLLDRMELLDALIVAWDRGTRGRG